MVEVASYYGAGSLQLGALVKTEGIMDSTRYQFILTQNLQTSVRQRKMKKKKKKFNFQHKMTQNTNPNRQTKAQSFVMVHLNTCEIT